MKKEALSFDLTGNGIPTLAAQVAAQTGLNAELFTGYDSSLQAVRMLELDEFISREQAVTIRGEIGKRLMADVSEQRNNK